ncbi:histidine kinase dimerization/phosphoacceptor domain-containing protein [Streptomyces sp. WAC 00631]|uniref:sensor histidine kinase n=1 Tax=Streptomyces sp. WAC 00631 TaxID=2203201 RepID=UPI001E41CA90|nr:histidine kinase dimerization/phosphoacceptor domain-containing protein [Streptomyces sp. WAC 00631]MCC5033005.1 histidine kinase dimerization/phosphoacceptor domain-containing protein [Streptomyces sp. WAC 00631]
MTTSGVGAAESGVRGAPAGPWWWERRRGMALDVALTVASVVECAAEGYAFAGEARIPVVLGVLLGVVAGSVLLVRRRWPIAVVLVAVAVSPAEMGLLLGLVGLYTLAASEVPRRITAVLAGMSMAGTLLVTFIQFQRDLGRQEEYVAPEWVVLLAPVLMSLGLTAPPVFLGLYVGARRRLVESLRERADGLERELSLLAERAEERAEWARDEERRRIAREMHDVVAHRVSLMVVHAAALQAVAVKDPERAVKNAGLVGDLGRQALTELREMLGVLRSGSAVKADGEPGAGAEPGAGPDSGSRAGSGPGAGPGPGAGRTVAAPGGDGGDGGDGRAAGVLSGCPCRPGPWCLRMCGVRGRVRLWRWSRCRGRRWRRSRPRGRGWVIWRSWSVSPGRPGWWWSSPWRGRRSGSVRRRWSRRPTGWCRRR